LSVRIRTSARGRLGGTARFGPAERLGAVHAGPANRDARDRDGGVLTGVQAAVIAIQRFLLDLAAKNKTSEIAELVHQRVQ
jgi:hypothetical protein